MKLLSYRVTVCFTLWIFSPFSLTSAGGFFNERIVTDLEIIESPYGVPVNLLYNETRLAVGRLNSVPGCPKSIDGYPWVYYGNPPRCFLSGYRGPCPENRILFLEYGSTFGVCGCECFQYTSMGEIVQSLDGRFKFCNMFAEQVQDNRDNICYDLHKRGPCGKNQWLVRDRTGISVRCAPQCPDSPFGQLSYEYRTGACYAPTPSGEGGAFGGAGGNIIPNQCPQQYNGVRFTYSTILRKCIPRRTNPGDYVFIG